MIYKSYTVLLRLSNRVEETYFLREIFQRTVARWSERQKHATRVPFLVSESYWRGSNHPGRSESVHHCSTPTSSIVRPFLRWPIGPQDLVLSNHSHLGRRPRYHFFFSSPSVRTMMSTYVMIIGHAIFSIFQSLSFFLLHNHSLKIWEARSISDNFWIIYT